MVVYTINLLLIFYCVQRRKISGKDFTNIFYSVHCKGAKKALHLFKYLQGNAKAAAACNSFFFSFSHIEKECVCVRERERKRGPSNM